MGSQYGNLASNGSNLDIVGTQADSHRTVVFASGVSHMTIPLPINDDDEPEDTEHFWVRTAESSRYVACCDTHWKQLCK